LIKVRNLTKNYGNHLAVKGISFDIEAGKIYGLLGPNGAGKSTTMNILTGCLAATSGEVKVDGHDIFEDPIEAKKHIGYLPEQPPVYGEMTPRE
jgi:ABC-2 type transport system ATP-binding protein